jgi:hypothetical protein
MSRKKRRFYVYILRRPDKHDPFYIWLSCPFYVGKGSNGRVEEHRRKAKNSKDKNLKNKIIRKLWSRGLDFEEEILFDNLTEQEAFELERKLIAKYGRINNGTGILANMTDGGEGTSGVVFSKESKRKMSKSHTGEKNHFYGKKHTQETIKRMSEVKIGLYEGENNPHYGKNHTEESKRRISESRLGELNPMYGKHHTEEARLKMSLFQSGENHPMRGKHHTKESKQKMSESQKLRFENIENHPMYGLTGELNPNFGKPRTDITKQKISEALKGEKSPNFGKKFSEEHTQRMRISALERNKKKRLEISGHEDYERCKYCHKYDTPENMYVDGSRNNIYHRECHNKYIKERRDLKKGGKPKPLNGMAKLNPDDIRKIRKLRIEGKTYKEIAEMFGVKSSVPCDICNRKSWVWVED